MTTTPEQTIAELLPKKWSEARRTALASTLADALESVGFLHRNNPEVVEVIGARVPVETVEVYGLTIRLDANGNAVSITSPYGLEVVE